jgi:hypothetical protein
MEQSNYCILNRTKTKAGDFRDTVEAEIRSTLCISKRLLKEEIAQVIDSLRESLPFFALIGKKQEVEILIVFYSSLIAKLNSSHPNDKGNGRQ